MQQKCVTLIFNHQDLSFSAGHFTIFSKTKRERLHGHHYHVEASLTIAVSENGLNFDCRHYEVELAKLTGSLNTYFLLPEKSPYMQIEEDEVYYTAHFNGEKIPFPKQDVKILPLPNISIEELAHWFLETLLQDKQRLQQHGILAAEVKVSSYPGIQALAKWEMDPAVKPRDNRGYHNVIPRLDRGIHKIDK